MTWLARGLTYTCAVLLVVGAAAPWVNLNGAAGGASPIGVAVAFAAAVFAVVAAYIERRRAVAVTGVAVTALSVFVIWVLPGGALMAEPGADGPATASVGLFLIATAGVMMYLAASLPGTRADAAPAVTADA